jgi:hypothetical protein
MPNLLRDIQGEYISVYEDTVIGNNLIKSKVGYADYIDVYSFIAFLQDFSQALSVTPISTPINFGLRNNTSFIELNISY